jgi:hypothetical protein
MFFSLCFSLRIIKTIVLLVYGHRSKSVGSVRITSVDKIQVMKNFIHKKKHKPLFVGTNIHNLYMHAA